MLFNIEEGNSYKFHITGEVELPDGYTYFRLRDPNGFQHLINASFYRNYGLSPGSDVICTISKINCSGQIFLEPVHPSYEPGKIYHFKIEEVNQEESWTGKLSTLRVRDVFGNNISLPTEGFDTFIKKGQKVRCLVERIKRGIPVLCPQVYFESLESLEAGKEYEFKVTKIASFGTRDDYFLIEKGKIRSRLRKKYYTLYGFGPGAVVNCRIVEQNGIRFSEPRHPMYDPGKIYDFEIIGEDKVREYPDKTKMKLILRNPYGKEIYIDKPENTNYPKVNLISCRVLDILKGKIKTDCSHKQQSEIKLFAPPYEQGVQIINDQ